jgi:nucleoside diphosphate kinase
LTTVNKSQELKCKNCSKIYSTKTGHNALKLQQKQDETVPKNSKIIQFFAQEKSEKDFDEKLIDFIVNGQHSFRIIEEQDFINLVKGLNQNVKISPRKTLKTKIFAKSSKIKSEIIQILSETNSKISLTSDI